MNEKGTMLVGFDIYKFTEGLCNQFLSIDRPDMTEEEQKAYQFGMESVLGLLNQIVNEFPNDEEGTYSNIAVHVPGLLTLTEFLTIDDVIKEIDKLNGNCGEAIDDEGNIIYLDDYRKKK